MNEREDKEKKKKVQCRINVQINVRGAFERGEKEEFKIQFLIPASFLFHAVKEAIPLSSRERRNTNNKNAQFIYRNSPDDPNCRRLFSLSHSTTTIALNCTMGFTTASRTTRMTAEKRRGEAAVTSSSVSPAAG